MYVLDLLTFRSATQYGPGFEGFEILRVYICICVSMCTPYPIELNL